MTTPVRYDNIHLHGKVGQLATSQMRAWLDTRAIQFTDLQYEDDTENLAAVSTWFRDENEDPIVFAESPLIIYDIVVWEADDGSDAYRKTGYAVQTSDLPSDFIELAIKVS